MVAQPEGGRLTVLPAPAKLTVSLRVTGLRGDGYHLIEAEMVSLDLADRLTFEPGWGLDVVAGFDLGYVDPQDNLVGRALKAVGREAHVQLDKRIPAGGWQTGNVDDPVEPLNRLGIGGLQMLNDRADHRKVHAEFRHGRDTHEAHGAAVGQHREQRQQFLDFVPLEQTAKVEHWNAQALQS